METLAGLIGQIVELERLTVTDLVTGLYNRDFLARHFKAWSFHPTPYLVVLFIDLDYFGMINDTLGHDTGDKILAVVAQRLTACLPSQAVIARFSGDEFVVLNPDVTSRRDAMGFVSKVQSAFIEPFVINGHRSFITASIGVSIYPQNGGTLNDLLRHADIAMHVAKNHGRNTFRPYFPYMSRPLDHQAHMVNALRDSLKRGELVLYYQPVVSVNPARIIGIEALLRWNHPERGLLSPDHFIPLAERTGLIEDIGRWTLSNAAGQLKEWQAQGMAHGAYVSVNVSMRQFQQSDLIHWVQIVLEQSGLHPHCLQLELTETTAMTNPSHTKTVLRHLKGAGVQVALDDFGTGFSSLRYLKDLPVDVIKIDGSFVSDMIQNPRDAAIVKTVIQLGQDLGIKTVAEKVETIRQVQYLSQLGCGGLQGYYFSRPKPPHDLWKWAQAWLAPYPRLGVGPPYEAD